MRHANIIDPDGDRLLVHGTSDTVFVTVMGEDGTRTAGGFTRAQLDELLDAVAPAGHSTGPYAHHDAQSSDKRTTPDPDETTGEALARLQAEMTRLLDEADAELRDEADGGVAAALIEKEAEQHDATEVRELRSALARELARGNALQDALDAADPRPLAPDAITDEMVERAWTESQEWTSLLGLTEDHVRALITAALTEPPARPKGAEKVEAVLHRYWSGDINGDDLADRIAEEMNR